MSLTHRSLTIALGVATALAGFALGRLTAPAQPDPRPRDLAGAIQSSLGEGDALERLARTAALLEGLEPEDLPAVVAVYERMIPSIDPWDLTAFFSAWARFDPVGALEYALAWPRRTMLEERRIGVRSALAGWAYADPAQARAAAEEVARKNPPIREDVWAGLVAGWARSDRGVEGLSAFLNELRPRRQREAAAKVAARELARAAGAGAALDWADAILGDASQDQAYKRAVFESAVRAAVGSDPARTGAWVLERAGADYALDAPAIVARRWGRADGGAAMRWLAAVSAGEQRDKGVREAFLAWATADWESARAWLETTPPTDLHDSAFEAWAERILDAEPTAALGWCERILDEARRRRCLGSGASRWYAKDPLAAEAWLQTSSLDEEARSQVRKAAGQSKRRRPRPGAAAPGS